MAAETVGIQQVKLINISTWDPAGEGPEAVVTAGTPEEVEGNPNSTTEQYLKSGFAQSKGDGNIGR